MPIMTSNLRLGLANYFNENSHKTPYLEVTYEEEKRVYIDLMSNSQNKKVLFAERYSPARFNRGLKDISQ
jgi:hypothetical protein